MLPNLCKKLNRSSQRRGRPIPPGPPSLENRSLGSAGAFSLRWTPAASRQLMPRGFSVWRMGRQTPAPGAGEGRVRSCRPRAQHSGCAAPRGPDPDLRPPPFTHSFAHSSVRAWPRAFTLRVFPPAASAAPGRGCGAVCTSGRLSSLRGVVRGPRLCP